MNDQVKKTEKHGKTLIAGTTKRGGGKPDIKVYYYSQCIQNGKRGNRVYSQKSIQTPRGPGRQHCWIRCQLRLKERRKTKTSIKGSRQKDRKNRTDRPAQREKNGRCGEKVRKQMRTKAPPWSTYVGEGKFKRERHRARVSQRLTIARPGEGRAGRYVISID